MSELIYALLNSFSYPVEYMAYTGSASAYFVYNFADERGALFADDAPCEIVYSIQVHFFAPLEFDHVDLKKQVRQALFAAGFTYATIQTFYEKETAHLVFECEYAEATEE